MSTATHDPNSRAAPGAPSDAPCNRVGGLRIGIDATCLGAGRGYGRFLRELLPPLLETDEVNDYVLFVDPHTAAEVGPLPARTVQPPTSAGQARAASARGRRGLLDMWRMGRAVARERLDVMYFPSVYSYYPVPGRTPVAVALHDTIAERYGAIVFPTRRNRWLWNAKVAAARRRARAIITVSEWSRRSLADTFHLSPEQIFVTPEAPGPVFGPCEDPEPRRTWLKAHRVPPDADYFVYCGGFNPHKNLHRLVKAFGAAQASLSDRRAWLILVGDYEGDRFHADVASLRRAIETAGVSDHVRLPGFVPDADLRHVYGGARALVIPSLEEGFGLPAVEAAACGTPCIATQNSPLPELLADGGIFVEPTDIEALRDALIALARDRELRARLGARALERARVLTWRATADATRAALESVARRAR